MGWRHWHWFCLEMGVWPLVWFGDGGVAIVISYGGQHSRDGGGVGDSLDISEVYSGDGDGEVTK